MVGNVCGASQTACTRDEISLSFTARRMLAAFGLEFDAARRSYSSSYSSGSTGTATITYEITVQSEGAATLAASALNGETTSSWTSQLQAKGGILASVTVTAKGSTTVSQDTNSSSSSSGLSTGAIIGISIGGMLVFVLIIGAIIWVVGCRPKEEIKHASDVHTTPVDTDDGAAGVAMTSIEVKEEAEEAAEPPKPPKRTYKHQAQYAKMFKVLDHDGDGNVTMEEMKKKLGLPEAEAEALFKSMDHDGSGSVNIEALSVFLSVLVSASWVLLQLLSYFIGILLV